MVICRGEQEGHIEGPCVLTSSSRVANAHVEWRWHAVVVCSGGGAEMEASSMGTNMA